MRKDKVYRVKILARVMLEEEFTIHGKNMNEVRDKDMLASEIEMDFITKRIDLPEGYKLIGAKVMRILECERTE